MITSKMTKVAWMACTLSVLLTARADASFLDFTLSEFTGDEARLRVRIDDMTTPGSLNFQLDVIPSPSGNIGDLRGLFFHISDESLLSGLTATGADVTGSQFSANNVSDLDTVNVHPAGPFDVGVEFGGPGTGTDDIQTTAFTLSHASQALDISLVESQDFAARMTSVGLPGGSRSGSSKLDGSSPVVPEPSTLVIWFLLACLAMGPAGWQTARRMW